MPKYNKNKLPSRHTSLGPDRAPHRSFYYAMGETEEDVTERFPKRQSMRIGKIHTKDSPYLPTY